MTNSRKSGVAGSNDPLAYFITFSCYGTWLHGEAKGSVDRAHNQPETPFLPQDAQRWSADRTRMVQPAYALDRRSRSAVLRAIREVCVHRGWSLRAVHVRTKHVHVVVSASAKPEKVMSDFKAYASRALNRLETGLARQTRWSRHGSTRYLWNPEQVAEKIHYTIHEQGEPMEVYQGESE